MSALSKYDEALRNAPARGAGLHQWVMKVACLGVLSDIPHSQLIADAKQYLIGMKTNEFEDALSKAANAPRSSFEVQPAPSYERFRPTQKNALDKFIEGEVTDYYELIESSKVLIYRDDGRILLETLYKPDEYLFLGDVYSKKVMQVKDWLECGFDHPHIIPNPMTGDFAITGNGAESRRCEGTVADLRYAVCEMDEVPLDKQVAFWLKCIKIKLPVAAVIHSGGKSLHGWVKVDCGTDIEKWNKDVKGWLFGEFGKQYGFDMACANRSRLSRMAGHNRAKGKNQMLLYLDGEA